LSGQLAAALSDDLEEARKAKEFKVGDTVRYTGKFLRSTGQYTGTPVNGKVVGLVKMGSGMFPRVKWSDPEWGTMTVAPANLEHDPRHRRKGKPQYFENLDGLFGDAVEEELLAEKGSHYFDGKDYYADTAFLNSVGDALPGMKLKHMGFGEFSLEGNGKSIEFDRMRGKKFKGQGGRSHKVYDNKKGSLVKELIKNMEKKGRSELVKEETELAERSVTTHGAVDGWAEEFGERLAKQLNKVGDVKKFSMYPMGNVKNDAKLTFDGKEFHLELNSVAKYRNTVHPRRLSYVTVDGRNLRTGSAKKVAAHIASKVGKTEGVELRGMAAQLGAALERVPVVEDWEDLDSFVEELEAMEEGALTKTAKAAVVAAMLLALGEAAMSRDVNVSNYRQRARTALNVIGERSSDRQKQLDALLKRYKIMDEESVDAPNAVSEAKGDDLDALLERISAKDVTSGTTALGPESFRSDNPELKRELERMITPARRFVRSLDELEEAAAELVKAATETERIRRTTGVERAMQRSPIGNATRSFQARLGKVYDFAGESHKSALRMAKMARISTRRASKRAKPKTSGGEITATNLVREVLRVTAKMNAQAREAGERAAVLVREAEKLLNQKSVISGDKLLDRVTAIVQAQLSMRDQVSGGLYATIGAVVKRMNQMTKRLMNMKEDVDTHIITLPWADDPEFVGLDAENVVFPGDERYSHSDGWLKAVA
jgi:hypothetical protein